MGAVRAGDSWVLNGHKWFTANGMVAEFLIAMVVTDADAGPYESASMIIVQADAPGLVKLRNIPTMAGEHERFGYGHAEILYENVRVPASNLIGKRGQGFLIAQARLGPGRIHHCMRWLGQARRAFDMLCERALQREAFGKKLASHETVQNWIADSAAEMQAARLMTLHAAWVIDTQGVPAARRDISLIKFFGAKVLHDVIDRAIQIHGSLGYSADLPLEEMYRHARAARMYDGPDEVHRVSVARQILAGCQAPPGMWPREHIPSRGQAAQLKTAREMNAEFGLGLEFIEANAENVPLPDASFDLAFSEYGASIWCDPYLWIPEAARLLRPGGQLMFMRNGTLQILCSPDDEVVGEQLIRPQKGMHHNTWVDEGDGGNSAVVQ